MVHVIVVNKDEARDIVLEALQKKGFDVVMESTHDTEEGDKATGAQAPDAPTPGKVLDMLAERFDSDPEERSFYRFVLKAIEKPLIEKALAKTGGNQLAAARLLGINRNTIRTKIQRLGIRVPLRGDERWQK